MDDNRVKLQQVISALIKDGQVLEVPVFGISMFPFLMAGTVVRVQKCSIDKVKKGDVVFFESQPKIILHRVIKVGDGWIQCKGDSLLRLDSVIQQDQLMGRVVAYKRNRSFKSVNSLSFRLYGRFMVVLHPITGYLLFPLAIVWQKIKG